MPKLAILDNVFPSPLSASRYAEFTAYLDNIEDSVVLSSGDELHSLGETKPVAKLIDDFVDHHREYEGRVSSLQPGERNLADFAELLYMVFLGNCQTFRKELIKSKIPFVFTLYPGGSFQPYHKASNGVLRRILSLPNFRKVIVTQPFARDYLLGGQYCREEQIALIPGVVVPEEFLQETSRESRNGNAQMVDDGACDICFVSGKYVEDGRDRGYDIFMDVVRRLISLNLKVQFHVVGDYERGDIRDDDVSERVNFHMPMPTGALLKFFQKMDILISPNRAGYPIHGLFDGFPTGAAVQAGLQEVAIFATDCLWQNFYLKDREEIVVIGHSPSEIAHIAASYITDRKKLAALKKAGQAAFRKLYNTDAQLRPRIELLRRELEAVAR